MTGGQSHHPTREQTDVPGTFSLSASGCSLLRQYKPLDDALLLSPVSLESLKFVMGRSPCRTQHPRSGLSAEPRCCSRRNRARRHGLQGFRRRWKVARASCRRHIGELRTPRPVRLCPTWRLSGQLGLLSCEVQVLELRQYGMFPVQRPTLDLPLPFSCT